MRNFEFGHEGKKYWYSRSVAVLGLVVGTDEQNNVYVLANKRGENTPDYQGCWCMPCGFVDFNETLEQAITREIFEETGVEIDYTKLYFHGINSIPEGSQTITIRFKIHLNNISKYKLTNKYSDDGEVDEVKWISIHDIDKYDWAFNHHKLINEFILNKEK